MWVCVFWPGFQLRPATPGWGVGLCVCSCARSACTQPLLARVRGDPATPGTDARCGCVCFGSGFGCAPPLLAGVLGCCVLVCALRLLPATPGWDARCWCVCLGSGFGWCTGAVSCGRRHRPLRVGGRHAGDPRVSACACSSWPGRAGRPLGRVVVRLTFFFAALAFCFAWPLRSLSFFFLVRAPVVSRFLWFPAPGALGFGAVLCGFFFLLPFGSPCALAFFFLGRWLLLGAWCPSPPFLCVWLVSSLPAVSPFFFLLRAPRLSLAFSGFRPRVPLALALCFVCFVSLPLLGSPCAVSFFRVSPGRWLPPGGCCLPPPPLPLVALFLFFFALCAPVLSGFLWFPALGALGLGAVFCLLCGPPASRLSVRSRLFRASRLAVDCSPVAAAPPPPPPFCVSRFSSLPLSAVCRVSQVAVLRCAAARCVARCCAVVCCVVLLRSVGAAARRAVPSGAPCCPRPCALWRSVLRCSPALCVFCRSVVVCAAVRRSAWCCVCPCVLCCAFPVLSALCGAVLRCAGALALCCSCGACCCWRPVLWCAAVCCAVFFGVLWCGAGPGGPWLSAGAVLWRPAVRFPLLMVLVCVFSLCVRCCVALRVVLFGSGCVCAVVGASCCGVSLCVVVSPWAFCGVVVPLWCVVVSCCAVRCPVVSCALCRVLRCCAALRCCAGGLCCAVVRAARVCFSFCPLFLC